MIAAGACLISQNIRSKQTHLTVTARSGKKIKLPVRSVKILDQLGLLRKLARPGYLIQTNSDYIRIVLFILSHHDFSCRELVEWTITTFKELNPSSVRASARSVLHNLCAKGYLIRIPSSGWGKGYRFVV